MPRKKTSCLAVPLFGALVALSTPSFATNYVVNSTDDNTTVDTFITLREAVNAASSNAAVGDAPAGDANDTISFDDTVFSSKQTITLTGGQLSLSGGDSITINGSAAGVDVSGNNASRVFDVVAVAATINNLTIRNGIVSIASANSFGGGIQNNGTLTLVNCTVSGNSASGNRANNFGGGIYNSLNLNLTNCTVSGNSANGGSANNYGGGIMNDSGGITRLTNVTLSGNFCNGSTANNIGGGIFNQGVANSGNSIISGNTAATAPDVRNFLTSQGYNLLGTGVSTLGVTTGNVSTNDPKLGALADNGGPTFTMLPAADSAAIDAGNTSLETDQRGVTRPQGPEEDIVAQDDIGAVEVEIVPPNTPPTVSDIPKTTNEDEELAFTVQDFDDAFTDGDDDELASIIITSLPTNGTLELDGTEVKANDIILRADLANLTYTPDTDYNGADSFGWNGSDGVATAAEGALVNITVTTVNDVPSFTSGGDVTVDENSGAYSQAWATNVSAGPDNENTQTLTFNVSNDNDTLFSVQPAISATGVLSFTPATNKDGQATVTVSLSDNGETDNGGDDQSDEVTFIITLTNVNDAPVAADGSAETDEDTPVEMDLATLVSDDKTSDANLIYTIVTQPAAGEGSVTLNGSKATYTPSANFNGGTSFTYQVEDEGGLKSAVKKVTISIASEEDAPVLAAIGNKSVDELKNLSFTATATDGDENVLTFSLQGAPAGASITKGGVFSWTPNEAQGPGSFTFKVRVYDGTSYDEEQITVTVREVNTAPVLELGGNRTLTGGVPFAFGITSYDVDVPAQGGGVYPVNAPSWINITNGPTVYGTPPVASSPYNVNLTLRAGDSYGAITQKSITLTVNSPRVVWMVEPTWDAGEGTLTYRLKNNTSSAINGVWISGVLRVPVKSMTKSIGSTSWNTQGNGYYGVYWNGFNLAAGREATLVIKVARPGRGTPVAQSLYCSYGPGSPPTLTTADVLAP